MLISTKNLTDKQQFFRDENGNILGYVLTKDILNCDSEKTIPDDFAISVLGKLESCKDFSDVVSEDLSAKELIDFCFNKAMEIVRNEIKAVNAK